MNISKKNKDDTSQLQGVLELLEKKQKNPGNSDIETNFFNEALEYLLSNSVQHWWCTNTLLPIARESLWLFSLPDHDPVVKYKKKLDTQLKTCVSCVQAYQTSKQNVRQRYDRLFPKQTVEAFFQCIDRFDLNRIKTTFRSKQRNFRMTNEVMCALLDTIYSPKLLQDPECDELFCNTFVSIQQAGAFPTFGTETVTYIFPLTLHHQRIVRFWSRKLIEKCITTDEYRFSDEDFMQVKDLLTNILKTFTEDTEDESFTIKFEGCPFEITQDLGELWKAFRLATGATSPEMLSLCLSESNISMPRLIQIQLSTSAEWLSEILKTITAMLLKMQSGFWGEITDDVTPYYDIVKQICEHNVFRTTMKIAREGNTGRILQRDGTRYPDDKLMAKIKSMLEWIYPYWSSLRHSAIEKDMTQKILDTTFGYFQMDTWGVMSKAYCAELGLQIIDQCLVDNSVPVDKIDEYVYKIVGFAKTDATKLPALVQHMPTVARNILSDLVDRDSTCINKAFNAIFQTDDLTEDIDEESIITNDVINLDTPTKSPYESIWTSVRSSFDKDVKKYPWLAKILFKAYANVASADIPNLLNETKDKNLSQECKDVLMRIADIRLAVGETLKVLKSADWEIRKNILSDTEMTKPMLHLICSPYNEININARKCIQLYPQGDLKIEDMFQHFFYVCQPLQVLDAFNSILREFIALNSSAKLNTFKSTPSLTQFLLIQANMLTNKPNGYFAKLVDSKNTVAKDEDGLINQFWDVCWRTISIILDKSLKWATEYRPTEVASIIVPTLDTATSMMTSRQLFMKAISITSNSTETTLAYDHLNTMADALSHWAYVTREDIISRLIPLTINILNALKKVEVKISEGAYDRLMTAATGVNESKLTNSEREGLFMALSAHEPTNFIFLNDDSDDEDVEWQTVNHIPSQSESMDFEPSQPRSSQISTTPSPSSAIKKPGKSRQTTLDQSFSSVSTQSPTRPTRPTTVKSTPQITTYFSATAANPHEISDDDDFDDQFDSMDYSQLPEEWLEPSKPTPPVKTVNKSVNFGEGQPMDIAEVPAPTNRYKAITKAVPIDTLTDSPDNIKSPAQQKKVQPPQPRPNINRVYVQPTNQPTYAVTSKGRKLRQPAMGFSKLKNLREEFRAERRLIATAKSPSAAGIVRQRYGDESSGSSSDSSSDEGGDESGLLGLIYDLDSSEPNIDKQKQSKNVQAESASVKALFETKPKRTIKLLETPIGSDYIDKKVKARAREQHRRQKITPSIDKMFKTLFSWDITENREIPPNANESMYTRVPTVFKTFEEYRSTFEPLIMLEAWAKISLAKEQLSQSDVLTGCLVEGRCHTNDFVDVTFGLPMSLINNNLSSDDLICVANHFGPNFFNSDIDTWKGKAFLGKVMSINQKKNMGEVVVRCYFTSDRISLLNSISPKTSWNILRIMSLTTIMREYAALEGLEYYDLGQEIIQPKPSFISRPSSEEIEQYRARYDVNEPQAEAIVCAIKKKKGFSLIQGPPGTGKTKTILSLIVSLLDQRTGITSEKPYGTGKLLVCAPSNAAVDEIAKRLKEGVLTSHGVRHPNIVRIGVSDSVNASVKDRILDRLIEEEMDSSGGKNGAPNGKWGAKLDTLHQDIRNIQINLDDVDREIARAGSDMVQMSILRDKRKALGQKLTRSKILLKDTYQDQKNYGKEMEISRIRARQKVFANADVVCATLSGSGHDMLTAMGVSFETVIVDEAAQSIEISSLIPLKFDTQRCILVGDPNQLPPTVLSNLASKYSYQQSLFMRLEYTIANEVNLLSIQYRMHPDISKFPSKLFYNSKLLDGPNMEKVSSALWHNLSEFPPYRFFNIEDGQEKVGRGKSIYNVAEADAAVALVDMLCSKLPAIKFASKIGVITPYKQQVSQLKSKFQKRFGNGILDVIDFNTVDGFQGQEKEIIIFSCVRAGQGRGIGFLADMRRMNVGLTRAKCSLFVLGHAGSLRNSDYWGDLVHDARRRSLMTDCRYPYFRHTINELSIPHNIFEKSTTIIEKKTIQYKKGPTKIGTPKAGSASNSDSETQLTVGGKRSLTSQSGASSPRRRRVVDSSTAIDLEMTESPSISTSKDESFLEKVRRDKELRSQSTTQSPSVPSSPTKTLSMNAYRASRGLSPLQSSKLSDSCSPNNIPPPPNRHPTASGSNASNLFINKRNFNNSRPRTTTDRAPPERTIGAKEKAILEHSAARDKLKSIRREEERRRESDNRPTATHIPTIIDNIQSNRPAATHIPTIIDNIQSNRPTATHIPTIIDSIQIERLGPAHNQDLRRTVNDIQSNGQRGGTNRNRDYDRRDTYQSRSDKYKDNRGSNNDYHSYRNQRRYN